MLRVVLLSESPGALAPLAGALALAGMAPAARRWRALGAARGATSLAADVLLADLALDAPAAWPRLARALAVEGRPPVVVLSPGARPDATIRALDAGADDVVTAPCAPAEVVARVDAVARRARTPTRAVSVGDALFEPASHAIVRHGRRFPLRPKEHALLCALLERRGQVVPRARLLAEVWGYAPDVATRTLDTHVRRLRRLLEHDPSRPRALVTVTALGYRLTADGGSPAALAS